MTLIKSISGIRGTIGGKVNGNLTPIDIVKFTSSYGEFIKNKNFNKNNLKIIVGRDARISGEILNSLIINTLLSLSFEVVDLGLSTTPTVEMAVVKHKANGGIILTASHNPREWNALKLLNEKGEFLSAKEGEFILEIAEKEDFNFSKIDFLGKKTFYKNSINDHIDEILKLELVDISLIKKANFHVVIDAVNSTGGIALPLLLEKLGVKKIEKLYCEPNGEFPHNPEPIPENLTEISKVIIEKNADIGFVVDPDVDRLAIVCEDGSMFGEEYTLVAVSDYVLQNKKGNTVSNLSSTKALKDITEKYNCNYFSSAVGEVNVVEMMKNKNAVIGGEGNGGIIYPELHYGRDAILGIALFLTFLAKENIKCSELRSKYPNYFISKNKIKLNEKINTNEILKKIYDIYKNKNLEISLIDGVKINFENSWVHLRKSNTEPIIRIYSESKSKKESEMLSEKIINEIKKIL
ncbi:MAG: phosphoglucosamine mutase [Bacteroidetes bacterium 4572_128]|nr:MAG: phosphoglucosamine mutase [Bacteroidetes bacterium 4572_128]